MYSWFEIEELVPLDVYGKASLFVMCLAEADAKQLCGNVEPDLLLACAITRVETEHGAFPRTTIIGCSENL